MTIIPSHLVRIPGERGVAQTSPFAVPGGSPGGNVTGRDPAELASIYGRTIPTGYGTRPVFGFPIWAGPIETYEKDGVVKRRVSFAMSFGYGSGASGLKARILKIEADGTLLLDRTAEVRFRHPDVQIALYPGDFDQAPDPTIEEVEGVGNVPAFRPHIYAVFRDFPLSDFGFSKIPTIRVLLNEFATDFNKWWQFERTPFPIRGDVATTVHAELVDWKRRLYYSIVNNVSTPDTDTEIETSQLRAFDIDAMQEVSQKVIYDTFAPFGPDEVTPGTSIMTLPFHVSFSTEPLYEGQSYTGNPIAPNILDNFAGYVDDFSGVVLLPYSGSIPNDQQYVFVDPLSGRVLCKLKEMNTLGFAAAMRRPVVYNFGQEDTGWRVLLLCSHIFPEVQLYQYNGPLLRQKGQIYKDSLYLRAAAGGGAYETPPGSGAIVGLVPNEYVEGSSYNYFYMARGSMVWRFFVSAYRLGSEGRGVNQSSFWELVADFTSIGTIKRLVMDVSAKELFVVLDDGALSHVAKMKTYRTPIERAVQRPAYTVVIEEDIIWTKALPFRCHYSSFPMQHNEQDFSEGYFLTRIDGGYKGALLANIDMSSGGFELMTFSFLSAIDQDDASSHFVDYDQRIVFDQQQWRLLQPETPAWVGFDYASGDGKVPLSDFLQWAGEESGFEAADITITGVTNDIWGSYIDRTTVFEPLLDDIATVYGLDWVQSEGKLKISRVTPGTGGTVRAALTKADLAPIGEGEDGNCNLRTIHADPATLPDRVTFTFLDKNLDYAANTVEAHRSQFPVSTSKGTETVAISIPIIEDSNLLFPLAYEALYRLSAESVSHEFRTSQRWFLLEPIDIVTVDIGSRVYKMKLAEVVRNGDWSLSFSASSYSVEERPNITVDPDDFTIPPIVATGLSYSQTLFIDTPSLFDAEAEGQAVNGLASFRTATISRGQSYWIGATVTIRAEGSTSAAAPLYATNRQPVWGKLLAGLTAVNYPTVEHDATLRLRLYSGTGGDFGDVDLEEMLDGENAALVGDGSEWELLGWRTIADLGGGVIELSELYRCQGGTELAGMRRRAGDFFIPLDSFATRQHTLALENLGTDYVFKARGVDQAESGAYATFGTVTSGPDRPLAVVNLHAVRDAGATDDIEISWTRRDRIEDWDWLDGLEPDLPCSEVAEEYELEIYDADFAVVRTETGLTSPTYTYTAADQTSDGFGLSDASITVRVYQISATVGRGWSTRYTLDVEI